MHKDHCRLFGFGLLMLSFISWNTVAAIAAIISVANASFEDISGETLVNEFTFGPLNGWQLYDPNGITNGGSGNTFYIGTLNPTPPVYFTNGAPHGERVGIAFNYAPGGGLGEYGFQQILADTLQANTTYQLEVEIGNIASGTGMDGTFFNLDGFPGYRVDLLAGGQILAQDNNSLAGLIPEGQFRTSLVSFTTGASHANLGQFLSIRLVNLNQIDAAFPGADLEVDFDHLRMSSISAVPEPSSLMLLSIAATPLVLYRGMKRRIQQVFRRK
jgi:hypothetical protein